MVAGDSGHKVAGDKLECLSVVPRVRSCGDMTDPDMFELRAALQMHFSAQKQHSARISAHRHAFQVLMRRESLNDVHM